MLSHDNHVLCRKLKIATTTMREGCGTNGSTSGAFHQVVQDLLATAAGSPPGAVAPRAGGTTSQWNAAEIQELMQWSLSGEQDLFTPPASLAALEFQK